LVVRSSTWDGELEYIQFLRARNETYNFEVYFVDEGTGEVWERRSSAGPAGGSVKTRHAVAGR
jgi:hypothetical protein